MSRNQAAFFRCILCYLFFNFPVHGVVENSLDTRWIDLPKTLTVLDTQSNISVPVRLARPPNTTHVILFCVSGDPTVALLSSYQLVFTPQNWNASQHFHIHLQHRRGDCRISCYTSDASHFANQHASLSLCVVNSLVSALHSLLDVAQLLLLPAASLFTGAFLHRWIRIPKSVECTGLHLSGGLIFGAVSVELVPFLRHVDVSLTLVGFFAGSVGMLLVWYFLERQEVDAGSSEVAAPLLGGNLQSCARFPFSMVISSQVDCMIDGLLIGISYSVKPQAGTLMALSMMLEMFFLGVSVAVKLKKKSVSAFYSSLIFISLPFILIISGLTGQLFLSRIPSSSPIFGIVLAFGIASLLYLTVEELLVEAHSEKDVDTPIISFFFFLGFIFVVVFDVFI
eukprot:Sdes_comp11180_c0_seq1m2715